MIISRKVQTVAYEPIQFGETELIKVPEHCHLGCVNTQNMSWDSHIRNNIKKAAPRVNLLKRCASKVPRSCKINIYKTFIRPLLEYGCVLFDNCSENLSQLLEKTQRNVAIICTRAYSATSHINLLKELGWPTLKKRREYYKLTIMYKTINNLTPIYLKSILSFIDEESRYHLRNQRNIKVPFARTVSYLKSFLPSSTRLWNALSNEVKTSVSFPVFKRRLKHSMFPESNPLYNYGTGRGPVHQARMRMGLSGLNSHRRKYNFIDNGKCLNCGCRSENVMHFLLVCPRYTAARLSMLNEFALLVAPLVRTLQIETMTVNEMKFLCNILLYGHLDLNIEENKLIFDIIFIYIEQSQRFA
jgi:hypothetical protein